TDAWNRLLVPVEITGLPGDVRVWQFQRPAKACLSYLVGVPGGNAVIVDPTRSPDAYLELAQVHDMAVTHVV
ncbi:MBL fold metallo-hydrolase, partial [Rhodococcus fascians]|nr:MBL fold metallo-hydrolase [Rhodococcus fascians]